MKDNSRVKNEEMKRDHKTLDSPSDVSNQPEDMSSFPLGAWFLGPRAENAELWRELLNHTFADYVHWRRNYFPSDPIVLGRAKRRSDEHEAWVDQLYHHLDFILNELKGHYPFHSPRYIAHMLSEQTLPSVIGYVATMLYNPNNVTSEAAPVTVQLEIEVGKMVCEMLGYKPEKAWAHLCSGGTIANLEALWISRIVQFIPFTAREYCRENRLEFPVKQANGEQISILSCTDDVLIGLPPNESIFLLRKLAHFHSKQTRQGVETILKDINDWVPKCKYNIAAYGLSSVERLIGKKPLFLVSSAAHYSIRKAIDVLGFGSNSIRWVPVNSRFRMDTNALNVMLRETRDDEYVAAVIGIVGTTEEGAVDPIHRIYEARQKLSKDLNRSFWIHVDAAWGGYIRSIFLGHKSKRRTPGQDLGLICDDYVRLINASEKFQIRVEEKQQSIRAVNIRWGEREIISAFLAMGDADSITVDPHKMGFVPYPAGIVAFRNGLVTELVVQKAQYISDESGGLRNLDELKKIDSIGPYILEGSKPGAAAAACWLAHKTIPLDNKGHGKIVKTTLLNAKKLTKYFVHHKYIFRSIHMELFGTQHCIHPFTFVPLFEPDTNIVCFVATPMQWENERHLIPSPDQGLRWLNELNLRIYDFASIGSEDRKQRLPISQPFFVSRTWFEPSQYSYEQIDDLLQRIGINSQEYNTEFEYASIRDRKKGLFVLRSAVMNPWHYASEKAGMNYLFEFLKFLHIAASISLNQISKNREEMESFSKNGIINSDHKSADRHGT